MPLIMPRSQEKVSRALVIQLARLGDLVQTLPALDALHARYCDRPLDLLCPTPLARLAQAVFPVDRVLPWDGTRCREWADQWRRDPIGAVRCLQQYIEGLSLARYDRAFNLNQHDRAVLAAHLLAAEVSGAGANGPLQTDGNSWTGYLRGVARDRGSNRVHLSDAFSGLCGVKPTGRSMRLGRVETDLPEDLKPMEHRTDYRAAVVVGAGEAERCVPPSVWAAWIEWFLSADARAQVVLVGNGAEREGAHVIQQALPSRLLSRLWDASGRTDLLQLSTILSNCRWVIGSDTGPLHLGAAVGAQAIGWYFAQARVHETGPYGEGHWVFQHRDSSDVMDWPIQASVELMLSGHCEACPQWDVWAARLDEWGAYFIGATGSDPAVSQRAVVWRQLSPSLAGYDESF